MVSILHIRLSTVLVDRLAVGVECFTRESAERDKSLSARGYGGVPRSFSSPFSSRKKGTKGMMLSRVKTRLAFPSPWLDWK